MQDELSVCSLPYHKILFALLPGHGNQPVSRGNLALNQLPVHLLKLKLYLSEISLLCWAGWADLAPGNEAPALVPANDTHTLC